eukprot:scaffold7029_cov375-Pinguiococcus_pyrenoidosus.AAC.5
MARISAEILHIVQVRRLWTIVALMLRLCPLKTSSLFPDSKTFVDRPLLLSPGDVESAFKALQATHGVRPSREVLLAFVDEHFASESSDLEPWTPPDWHPELPEHLQKGRLQYFLSQTCSMLQWRSWECLAFLTETASQCLRGSCPGQGTFTRSGRPWAGGPARRCFWSRRSTVCLHGDTASSSLAAGALLLLLWLD